MIARVAEDQIYITAAPLSAPIVRPAAEADVPAIVEVVSENARLGHLLPRSAENIRSSLPNWLVAEVDGRVVGIGSLLAMSPALVEVRSLAVLPNYRRYGVGALIVRELIEQARERGIPTVFALTRAVSFFERLGFVITNRERFPEKVWKDCVICPLQHACDETAVVYELDKQTRRRGDKEGL
jgi:amino-acid N-acetyltransferase